MTTRNLGKVETATVSDGESQNNVLFLTQGLPNNALLLATWRRACRRDETQRPTGSHPVTEHAARKLENGVSPGKGRKHHTQLNLGQAEIGHDVFAGDGHVGSQYIGYEACHEQEREDHPADMAALRFR